MGRRKRDSTVNEHGSQVESFAGAANLLKHNAGMRHEGLIGRYYRHGFILLFLLFLRSLFVGSFFARTLMPPQGGNLNDAEPGSGVKTRPLLGVANLEQQEREEHGKAHEHCLFVAEILFRCSFLVLGSRG